MVIAGEKFIAFIFHGMVLFILRQVVERRRIYWQKVVPIVYKWFKSARIQMRCIGIIRKV